MRKLFYIVALLALSTNSWAQYKHEKPKSIDGIFTQTITTYDYDDGEVLTGSFSYQSATHEHGKCLQWEYDKLPSKQIQEGEHAQYGNFLGCDGHKTVGSMRMRLLAHMLISCITGEYLQSNADFKVRKEPTGEVVLFPKRLDLKALVKEIHFHYNDLNGMATNITIIEPNGDRSVIEIEHLDYVL